MNGLLYRGDFLHMLKCVPQYCLGSYNLVVIDKVTSLYSDHYRQVLQYCLGSYNLVVIDKVSSDHYRLVFLYLSYRFFRGWLVLELTAYVLQWWILHLYVMD